MPLTGRPVKNIDKQLTSVLHVCYPRNPPDCPNFINQKKTENKWTTKAFFAINRFLYVCSVMTTKLIKLLFLPRGFDHNLLLNRCRLYLRQIFLLQMLQLNFFISGNFHFLLFQLHQQALPYPQKKKLPEKKKINCNIDFPPKCRYLKSFARDVELQVTNTLLLCMTNYLLFNVFRRLMNYNHSTANSQHNMITR